MNKKTKDELKRIRVLLANTDSHSATTEHINSLIDLYQNGATEDKQVTHTECWALHRYLEGKENNKIYRKGFLLGYFFGLLTLVVVLACLLFSEIH